MGVKGRAFLLLKGCHPDSVAHLVLVDHQNVVLRIAL